MMIRRLRTLLPVLATAGWLWTGALLLPGCGEGGSSDGPTSLKPSAEKQAELDRINKETAAAHQKGATKAEH